MHIDGSEGREVKQGAGQDTTVGSNHKEVRLKGCKLVEIFLSADLGRLENRDSMARCQGLHRRRLDLSPSALGAIGLADDSNYIFAMVQHGL